MVLIKTKNAEKFQVYVSDLIKYITPINSIESKKLNKALFQLKRDPKWEDKEKYFSYVLKNMQPYIKYIIQTDEYVFTKEAGNKPLNFVIGFDFKHLWPHLNHQEKKVVFRYLQLLYIQASLTMDQNKTEISEIIENIKIEKELSLEAENNPDYFNDQSKAFSLDGLLANTILLDLTNDIKNNLDLESLKAKMLRILANSNIDIKNIRSPEQIKELIPLITNNPEFKELSQEVQNLINDKLKQRNLNETDFKNSLITLKENLLQMTGNLPFGGMLKKIIKNLDLNKLFDTIAKQTTTPPSATTHEPLPSCPEGCTHTSTPTSTEPPQDVAVNLEHAFQEIMNNLDPQTKDLLNNLMNKMGNMIPKE